MKNHAERLAKLCEAGAKALQGDFKNDLVPPGPHGQRCYTGALLVQQDDHEYPLRVAEPAPMAEEHRKKRGMFDSFTFFAAAANSRATLALAARGMELLGDVNRLIGTPADGDDISLSYEAAEVMRALGALLRQWASDTGTGENQNE
jgi:hypothetical protein